MPDRLLCVAVGYDDNDGAGYIATSTNPTAGASSWNVVRQIDNGSLPIRVSCPSVSLCVAVDAGGNVLTSTNPTGGAGAWTVTRITSRYLDDISCPSASLCVAADNSGNVITSTNPTGGAGAWSVTNVDGWNGLQAVSCPSAALCVASDWDGNVVTSTDPTGGAGAWTVTLADPASGGSTHALNAVSCPSASLCVGADDSGNVVTSTNPTGGAGAWTVANVDGGHWLSAASRARRPRCASPRLGRQRGHVDQPDRRRRRVDRDQCGWSTYLQRCLVPVGVAVRRRRLARQHR